MADLAAAASPDELGQLTGVVVGLVRAVGADVVVLPLGAFRGRRRRAAAWSSSALGGQKTKGSKY